ncbi:MAG: hypothetical protein KDC44_07675, partial [Phaeodactylibacter sp.]|nr:hypothetical protein [Phaeodactylibacter sp.]
MYKPIFVLLSFYFLGALMPGTVTAQSIQQEVSFSVLETESNSINSGVNDILEDHRGYLWLASWSGLAKYDGYDLHVYRQQPGNPKGLKSNKVTTLFEDRNGNLWIGTSYTGFYRYNRELDNFEQFANDPQNMNSLSNNNVWAIFEDQAGYLWIGTEKGLNRFDPTTGQFIHFRSDPLDSRSLKHDFVYTITQSPDGTLWIGTEEGLNRVIETQEGIRFIYYDLAPSGLSRDDYLAHNFIYQVKPSKFDPQALWICTSIGVKKVRFSTDQIGKIETDFYGHRPGEQKGLSHPFVPDLIEESDSTLWVATYDGLNHFNIQTSERTVFYAKTNDPNQLSSNVVRSLYQDKIGNIWIGLDKGVNRINRLQPGFQPVLLYANDNINRSVTTIVPSSGEQGIWIGTGGGGLFHLAISGQGISLDNLKGYTFEEPKMKELSCFVKGLLIDRRGGLWIATDGAGIIRVRESDILDHSGKISQYEQFTKSDVLSDDYVMSLLEMQSGLIWAGYWDKGLDLYDPGDGSFRHFLVTSDLSVNFQDYPIVHLLETIESGQSYLWLGTRGGGIYKLRFDSTSFELHLVHHYKYDAMDTGSLSNNFINNFFLDTKGRLWVATDSGLNLIEDPREPRVSAFFETDGLKNSTIQSIQEDAAGTIWVSTHQGLSRLQWISDEVQIKNFDRKNGLQDSYFNDDAAARIGEDQLIFGGVSGLSVLWPAQIKADSMPPKTTITGLNIYNEKVPIGPTDDDRVILQKSIAELQEIRLKHSDNVITFEFTALHLGAEGHQQYAYKLDGFDKDWVYSDGAQRSAHYTNLPHGDYTFSVKADNGDGVWSEPASIR